METISIKLGIPRRLAECIPFAAEVKTVLLYLGLVLSAAFIGHTKPRTQRISTLASCLPRSHR